MIQQFDEITWAEKSIYDTYGVKVSVMNKLKSLFKFGRSESIGTTNALVAIMPTGITEETLVEQNLIAYISSSSTADLQDVKVEYHTVEADVSVSSITQAAGVATVTTGAAHGYVVGDWVNAVGANEAGYNGSVQVDTVPTTTTFTYAVDSGTATPATGTITVNGMKKTFGVQTVTLAGRTKTALPTACARVSRMYLPAQRGSVDLAGDVYIYEDDTVTNGVPDTDTKVHLQLGAGENNSEKCATTVSDSDYLLITSFRCSVLEKTSVFIDASLRVKEIGGQWRKVEDLAAGSGVTQFLNFSPIYIVPANADVRIVATSSEANTEVTASIQGYLAN